MYRRKIGAHTSSANDPPAASFTCDIALSASSPCRPSRPAHCDRVAERDYRRSQYWGALMHLMMPARQTTCLHIGHRPGHFQSVVNVSTIFMNPLHYLAPLMASIWLSDNLSIMSEFLSAEDCCRGGKRKFSTMHFQKKNDVAFMMRVAGADHLQAGSTVYSCGDARRRWCRRTKRGRRCT